MPYLSLESGLLHLAWSPVPSLTVLSCNLCP
jgi:hypothetical protein